MVKDAKPIFIGEPLPGGTKRNTFYSAFRSQSTEVQLGDVVQVKQSEGVFYGVLLVLWQEGVRVKTRRQWAEILWFHEPKANPQELQITAATSCVDIAEITKVVSVKSREGWEDEEKNSVKQSKAAKALRFYCHRGFYEQAQITTPIMDWEAIYTKGDREDLEGFRSKIVDMITDYAKSKVSTKLKGKIKTQKTMEYASRLSSDDESSDESEESESSVDSTDSEISDLEYTNFNKRNIHQLDQDDDDEDIDLIKDDILKPKMRTPKKPKLVSANSTPRTPKRFTTITTPGSKSYRVQAPLEVSPLPSRVGSSPLSSQLSPHQLARQKLHVAEVPLSLPCREVEFTSIYEQVESAILENESALIYVSGTPGTGKTATVREVINALQQKVVDEELFPFKFVEINGMKIPDPSQAYSKLWETLTGQRVTASHALSLLQKQFKSRNPSRIPCVVLMDELDQLTTTKQEVMYNFFQWPNMPNTRLIVIAVANTMDLPERTLAHKVSSRLGLTRIPFAAYTRPQLNAIIKSRLENVDSIDVDNDAIDYACMRVSRVSGDARRALDICRRAFELAEPDFHDPSTTSNADTPVKRRPVTPKGGRITIQIMQKAFTEMTSSPLQLYLQSLPFLSKVFLKSLLACLRRSGLVETHVGDVIDDATRLCKVNTNPDLQVIMNFLQPFRIVATGRDLASCGVIFMEESSDERSSRVRLRVPEPDVLASWSDDAEFAKIT